MSAELKPIPCKINNSSPEKKPLSDLPDIIQGGGVFHYQYHDHPDKLGAEDILARAFDLGIRAVDTSEYYGPSEIIVGEALHNIREKYPRNSYFISTKAGRMQDKFDYSPAHIRESVERSLARLHTHYVDILYLHDVEFVSSAEAVVALREMFKLKEEGKVHYVGMSGYPVDYLFALAKFVKKELGHPLDLILSYCNLTLQNNLLSDYVAKFQDPVNGAGIKYVLTASPISMGLIRAQDLPSFHPAPKKMKEVLNEAAAYTQTQGVDLADLAVRYALRNWHDDSGKNRPYVYGLSTIREVENAVKAYWDVHGDDENQKKIAEEDKVLTENVHKILRDQGQLNATWESGIAHPEFGL